MIKLKLKVIGAKYKCYALLTPKLINPVYDNGLTSLVVLFYCLICVTFLSNTTLIEIVFSFYKK